jgi:hypothetical protein
MRPSFDELFTFFVLEAVCKVTSGLSRLAL